MPSKSSVKSASPADLELQPILNGQAPSDGRATKVRAVLRDPVTNAALKNVGLILTWYIA